MDNAVELAAIEDVTKPFGVSYVELDELELVLPRRKLDIGAFYLGRVEIVEVVDDRDVPAAFVQEKVYQMRADESGPAGYQNIFCHDLLMI